MGGTKHQCGLKAAQLILTLKPTDVAQISDVTTITHHTVCLTLGCDLVQADLPTQPHPYVRKSKWPTAVRQLLGLWVESKFQVEEYREKNTGEGPFSAYGAKH